MDGPVLTTERLILRPPAREDFDGWAAFSAEPETMQFLGGPVERPAAWRSICAMTGAWTISGFSMFSLIDRASGRWVGRAGPWQPEGWPGTEVGWGVLREFAGRGYAREAAVESIDFAFDKLGWSDVIHCIAPDNVASIRLAERLGSKHRGETRLPAPLEEFRVDAWGQTRAEWRARSQ
jgi:RimJ/RimL family protein N-acetyltransferase